MGQAARFLLRAVRRLARQADILLAREASALPPEPDPDSSQIARYRMLLDGLDREPSSTRYLDVHGMRLARTLSLIPSGDSKKSILELGCYMQLTPLLASELGYGRVRGAYFGAIGHTDERVAQIEGREVFRCQIDLFDAETDRYPYPDNSFDVVLACEIFEHFRSDPMHMVAETHRILRDGGALLLTTPNCASIGSVARALRGENPSVFSHFQRPRGDDRGVHMREYTPSELAQALTCGGFEVQWLFTERFDGGASDAWVLDLIEQAGFDTALRGEQVYAMARKRQGATIDRYPGFLYVE